MDIGLLIVRVVLGAFVAVHGIQKTTYLWGGGGLEASSAEFRADGFAGGKATAFIAAGTQIAAGAALVLGLLTPLASAGVIAVMSIATIVKLRRGFWSQDGGYEYPLFLTALGVAVAWTGPGAISLDGVLGLSALWVPVVSIAATLAGLAGAAATYVVLHRRASVTGGAAL
ncbi:DoxX family protein [Leifsonia sp. NPDC058248]|uniref:DoxX family protein n=1 Tax=Leifsonia sp. NPDC058248 TaxID=3346402 RepID=UPI0036DBADD5